MLKKAPVAAGAVALSLLVAACGGSQKADTTTTTSMTVMPAHELHIANAADLRTKANILLGDHLVLASKATGAALGGRTGESNAYATQLNANGSDLGSLVESAFGGDAQKKFNGIWSAHNGFFVDYTTGVAKGDKAIQDKAVSDLTNTYVPQFSDFVATATGLPKDTVTVLARDHVLTTKAIVDAQASKDWPKAVAAIEAGYAHMQMIADPLANAIAGKFPDKFPVSGTTKAIDLRVTVNLALQDHLYLATSATDAALGGRADEFKANGDALNKNGTTIGALIGSVYGSEAEFRFNQIWSAHNGYFVNYATGVAKSDKPIQDKAVKDLTNTYVPQLTDFLVSTTGLPQATLTQLVADHVITTKTVVDDQAVQNWTKTAADDRKAAQHMQSLADPLADAIAQRFPDKFGA